LWFARALAEAGHEVVAPLRSAPAQYSGPRGARVEALPRYAEIVPECPFGSDRFLALAGRQSWDELCHHAARVGDYRSPEFDVAAALAENTHRLPAVLRAMSGLRALVLTGSVFEQDEGAGSTPLRAFSPYGLSKGLTAQTVHYWCDTLGVAFRKFVIPNPFGPHEEPRFCSYLMRCFRSQVPAEVRTPRYVRDNIHVDLLAAAYALFVDGDSPTLHPSGYVESQGRFAIRFATEIGSRLGLAAVVREADQTDFSEPMIRINTDPAAALVSCWTESDAWDALVAFYRNNAG
jgi:nucleoside-diphosphate-sugar epimerase